MSKLEVPKSQAVELLVALGIKIAKKWNCKKLTERINEIEELPDEPLSSEELDELAEKLMDAEEAVVVDNEGTEEEEADEEEADFVEEEEKSKKGKGKKGKKKGNKESTKKTEKKESIDSVTLALLKSKPMTLETLVKAIVKRFPDHDEESIERTTKRRVTGHLQAKYDVEIHKSDKGAYSIK